MKSAVPFNLLVLCTGNICRSPVAEAIFQKMCVGYNVSIDSAGVGAPIGVSPDPLAAAKALELGYSIRPEKKSRQVSLLDIQKADLILVMENFQKREICNRSSAAAGKTFLLGHWTGGEIDDPIGKDAEFFTSNVQTLELACRAWVGQMQKSGFLG